MEKIKGMSKHPLRTVYNNMVRRCYLPTDKAFKYYGGRGIKVCDKWLGDRDSFYCWALLIWKEGLQLDRINNNGDYSSENCRFITPKENIRNSSIFINRTIRESVISDYQSGIKIAPISRYYKISRPTVYFILKESGIVILPKDIEFNHRRENAKNGGIYQESEMF